MTTVYDIIDRIREEKNLSTRKLAQLAKIPPTTLESMMTRRPEWAIVSRLQAIARVFGLDWTDFYEPGREEYVIEDVPARVSCQIASEAVEDILKHALEKSGEGIAVAAYKREPQPEATDEHLFRKSTAAILNRLNSEGLMEAMRHLLEIAADPRYCKKNNNNAEV